MKGSFLQFHAHIATEMSVSFSVSRNLKALLTACVLRCALSFKPPKPQPSKPLQGYKSPRSILNLKHRLAFHNLSHCLRLTRNPGLCFWAKSTSVMNTFSAKFRWAHSDYRS